VVVFIEDSFALQARNNRPQVGRSAGYFFRHGQSPPETTFDPIDRPQVERPPRLRLQLTPPPALSDLVPSPRTDPEGAIDLHEREVTQESVRKISQADFCHHNVCRKKIKGNYLVVPGCLTDNSDRR
jgi:hypothetical protein